MKPRFRILLLFTILLQAPPLLAVPGFGPRNEICESLVEKSQFVPASEGLAELGKSAAILGAAATVHLPGDSRCSGAFVSDEGHILLASHCLEICPGYLDARKSKDKNVKLDCEITVNGETQMARVLAMSRCRIEKVLAAEPAELTKKKQPCHDTGDIAVLLPEKKPAAFSCLKLGQKAPGAGHFVYTIGAPAPTARGSSEVGNVSKKDSAKSKLFLSQGITVQKTECRKPIDPDDEESEKIDVDMSGSLYRIHRYLQTTVDIRQGSSGGPLIDEGGEIVGVASFFNPEQNSDHSICAGATFFEKIDRLAATAKAWNSEFDPSKVKCSSNLAVGKNKSQKSPTPATPSKREFIL